MCTYLYIIPDRVLRRTLGARRRGANQTCANLIARTVSPVHPVARDLTAYERNSIERICIYIYIYQSLRFIYIYIYIYMNI